jgi:hypothetical protein
MESATPPPSPHRHRVDLAALAAARPRCQDALAGYPELRVRVPDWLAAGIAPLKEGD